MNNLTPLPPLRPHGEGASSLEETVFFGRDEACLVRLRGLALILLLLTACATPPASTATPPPTATPIPPTATITVTIAPSATVNLTPSATSALAAASPNIDATLAATFLPTPLAALPGDAPPFTIKLPTGWHATYTLVPLSDSLTGATLMMNVAAYAGPVADKGTGFILALWNFPSATPFDPAATITSAEALQRQILLADGFRMLRGTVVDISCTVGNYGETDFSIGGQKAVGQRFQAASCQNNQADTAGWYAGLRLFDRNMLFFAYIDPVSDYNNGQKDIQAILDGVVFLAATATPFGTPAAINAPAAAGSATPALTIVKSATTIPLPATTIAPSSVPSSTPTRTPELN